MERPKLYADTSKIAELEQLFELGIFSGITTNPIIVAKEAGNSEPRTYYEELAKRFPGLPISIQLLDRDIPTLIQEAKSLASISPDIVIKVPMFGDGRGLAVLSVLMKEKINTNVTALMKAEQLMLALLAGSRKNEQNGPTYVSLFFNRIKDAGGNPNFEIGRSRDFIDKLSFRSKIITGSIRRGEDVYEAAIAGSHIVTVTPKVIWSMIKHQKSDEFIAESENAWNSFVSQQIASKL